MLAFNHLGKLGQLGNQMFQYASTKGIASKLNIPFMIPDHKEIFDDGIGNRYPILIHDAFNLDGKRGMLQTQDYIQETTFHFEEKFFNILPSTNVSLWGFFQTEKYFKHIEDDIRKDFTFHNDIFIACKELRETVDNPIALHIRRGDFIWNNAHHPPLGLDYYEKALKEFDDDRNVIIFSDDTKWCKEQNLFESDRFIVAEDNDQFHDLCLMSMCDDFIIANSTFSWWGAWLGNRGKVIAPKKWFGENLNHDTKDLYCEEWILL
tara:strand:+ start:329 stop:1120 length:792 start_codon:yes stop_codon:yes gene_type:complete